MGLKIVILAELGVRRQFVSEGGTAAYTLRLNRALRRLGSDVSVLVPKPDQFKRFNHDLVSQASVRPVGSSHKLGQLVSFTLRVLSSRPQVIIANDSRAALLALFLKSFSRRISLVCVFHHRNVIDSFDKNPKGAILSRAAKGADAIVAVSSALRDEITKRKPAIAKKVWYLPNPVYSEVDVRDARENVIKRPSPESFHIIFVGRLSDNKNPKLLTEVLWRLQHEFHQSVDLTLLGTGPQQQQIAQRAKELGVEELIRFEGFVDKPMRFMVDADCLVVPSKQEAFGNVLVEAMALGVPVVSADCPVGPREILKSGKYGSLVRVDDASAMAREVSSILSGQRDYTGMREYAYQFSEEMSGKMYKSFIDALRNEVVPERRS